MSERAKHQVNLSMNPRIERDREMIVNARAEGKGALAKVFVRLSGPGWLQSAITLGGGSLSSSMYLGMLGGFAFLAFLIIHVYLTTTGHTVGSHIKAMITGWESIENQHH